jgi:tetratricopeptide (TPR) repeat protein
MAKQRQVRIEQRSALAAMQQLETRSDDELHAETKYRAAAQAILGARAAERYDAQASREHYRKAIAAARPQERMQLRRMADASLALAERRAGDLKDAVERLGQAPPSNRQLMMLRFMGLVAPPPGASPLLRLRGILIILGIIVALMAIGLGIVELVALPFGGVSIGAGVLLGLLLVIAVLAVMALLGRRRQNKARAAAG